MFAVNQPEVMIGNAAEKFDEQGNLTDETTKEFIRKLLQGLVALTRKLGENETAQKAG
jgi:chromate reductase